MFSPYFADINGDGLQDLLAVGDFLNSQLYQNIGSGVFDRVTSSSNTGTDENGMGTAVGDYDNDGDLDWFISSIRDYGTPEGNWGTTGNRLFQNNGTGVFTDVTSAAGVRDGYWGWGSAMGDLDNDGDLDLLHVNGWPEAFFPSIVAKFNNRPATLFENNGTGVFSEVAIASGLIETNQGRGLILFDYDNDGDLDVFIANNQQLIANGSTTRLPGPPALFRNDSCPSNHWLKVTLNGTPPLHRNGMGSRVYIKTGSKIQMRELHASTGFLAHGPGRIAHFGLGETTTVEEVRAAWVNGDEILCFDVAADQALSISSPASSISKRAFLSGEDIVASGAAVAPTTNSRQWVVGGVIYPDPLTLSISEAGEHVLRLNVLAGDGVTVVKSELIRITVHPLTISLMLSKGVNDATPNVGDTIVYTVTVTNSGPNSASNMIITDTLPGSGFSLTGSGASQGGFANPTWTVGPVSSGNVATLTLTGTVTGASAFTNEAEVTSVDQDDPDSTPGDGMGNDWASVIVTPQQADLGITQDGFTGPGVGGQSANLYDHGDQRGSERRLERGGDRYPAGGGDALRLRDQ